MAFMGRLRADSGEGELVGTGVSLAIFCFSASSPISGRILQETPSAEFSGIAFQLPYLLRCYHRSQIKLWTRRWVIWWDSRRLPSLLTLGELTGLEYVCSCVGSEDEFLENKITSPSFIPALYRYPDSFPISNLFWPFYSLLVIVYRIFLFRYIGVVESSHRRKGIKIVKSFKTMTYWWAANDVSVQTAFCWGSKDGQESEIVKTVHFRVRILEFLLLNRNSSGG